MLIFKRSGLKIFLAALIFWLVGQSEILAATGLGETVAVVKSKSMVAADQIVRGVRLTCERPEAGVSIQEYQAQDPGTAATLAAAVPALIVALGKEAFDLALSQTGDQPLVVSRLMHPADMSGLSQRAAGVTLFVPISLRLECLTKVMPGIKRVGVIYDPAQNQADVDEGAKAASGMGIELIRFPVKAVEDVVGGLSHASIDVLLMIPDTIVCQPAAVKAILMDMAQKKIPVAGISRYYAQSGALIAIEPDYLDHGRQVGETALRILKGEKVSSIAFVYPVKTAYFLNIAIAERLGCKISDEVKNQATGVFGQ